MADVNGIKEKLDNAVAKASENVKELDMGVALTKAQDMVSNLDLEGKKKDITDFLDSPQMDELKSAGRTLKDFLGFVPNYVQSIPGMVKDGIEKITKK